MASGGVSPAPWRPSACSCSPGQTWLDDVPEKRISDVPEEAHRKPRRWRYTATVAASDDALTRILTVVHVQPCKLLRASLDLERLSDEQVVVVVDGLEEDRALNLLHRLERLIGVQSMRCEPLQHGDVC